MVACPTLSKMGIVDLLYLYTKGDASPKNNLFIIARQILRYYVISARTYIFIIFAKILFLCKGQKMFFTDKRTYIIDTYYKIEDLLGGLDPQKDYLTGVVSLLSEYDWDVITVPRFYGDQNLSKYSRVFDQLRNRQEKVITEYQLLKLIDYLRLLLHITIYPLMVIYVATKLKHSREDEFIKCSLIKNLHQDSLSAAVRYLASVRLSKIIPHNSRCLQWNENQAIDKCFNLGLKKFSKDIVIYGAQLYIWPPELLNIHVDSSDMRALRPDILLVNGPYYRPDNYADNIRIGPSLRYSQLWYDDDKVLMNKKKYGKALVLLPYYIDQIKNIIDIALQIESIDRLIFKFHPTYSLDSARSLLPNTAVISRSNIYQLFSEIDYVIGASTGSLLEAIAMGIPVISITIKNAINYSYLPAGIGQGTLWVSASTVSEATEAKNNIVSKTAFETQKMTNDLTMLRSQLFTRPTKEVIRYAFDL